MDMISILGNSFRNALPILSLLLFLGGCTSQSPSTGKPSPNVVRNAGKGPAAQGKLARTPESTSSSVVGAKKRPTARVKYISVSSAYRGSLAKGRTQPSSGVKSSTTPRRTPVTAETVSKQPGKYSGPSADFKQIADEAFEKGNYSRALEFYERIVRREPTKGVSRYNVGAVYLAARKYKSAVGSFTDALEFGYSTAEVYQNLGLAYLGLGKTDSARKVWTTARKQGLKSAEIETSLGLLLLDEKKRDEARAYFDRAIQYDRDYPASYNGLGVLALQEGKLGEAIELWKKAEAAERRLKSVSARGFSIRSARSGGTMDSALGILVGPDLSVLSKKLGQALALTEEGRFDDARTVALQVQTAEKNNPSYWSLLGYINSQVGEFSEAETAWRRSIELGSVDVAPAINLAVLELSKQNVLEADAFVDKALEIDPAGAVALSLKGDVALANRNPQSAKNYYERALRADPALVPALNNLALIYATNDKYSESLDLLARAVNESAGDPDIRYNLALANILVGKLHEAENQLHVVEKSGSSDAGVYLHLGYVVGTLGRYGEAKTYFEKALQMDPESALVLNNLGVVNQKAGDPKMAEQYYNRAIDLEPRFAEAYNNLGAVSLELKKDGQAVKAYEKAVALSAIDHESRRNLGHLLLAGGDADAAVSHLQLALALKPKDLDTLFDLALAYRNLKKVPESIAFFETYLELAQNDGSRVEQVLQAERALQKLKYP